MRSECVRRKTLTSVVNRLVYPSYELRMLIKLSTEIYRVKAEEYVNENQYVVSASAIAVKRWGSAGID